MSRVLGIIAEYNPFHNGHLYHIEESKKETNCDTVVCVMGGNFMQRGEPSLIDKWSKTEMALNNGVDLVLELPLVYNISSAENFAFGAVKTLDSLGLIDCISFGSECGDLSILQTICNILLKEPPEYLSILNHELSKGLSYPEARENALLLYINDIRKFAHVLSGSNNILGIEYLKALAKIKSKITPITIKRKDSAYNSTSLNSKGFSSATSIRKNISKPITIEKYVPNNVYEILKNKINRGQYITNLKTFEKEIIYKLRMMPIDEIAMLPDVSEGLEHAIKNAASSCNNLEDLIMLIKSKRYTQTRIQRILLCALLNITKTDVENSKKGIPYVRVLGVTQKGKELLSKLSKNKKIQVITSPKEYMDKSKNKVSKVLFAKDILASDIYTLGYEYNSKSNLDFTMPIINK